MTSESTFDLSEIRLLSAKEGLMLFFTLPTIEKTEIQGMVQLQAEELTPYPLSKTCYDWEIIWKSSTHCRVVVVLCERSKLDAFLLPTQKNLRRVDVDVLAYWEGILNTSTPEQTLQGFHVLILESNLYLLAADHRGLCMMWALQNISGMTLESLEEEIALAETSISTSGSFLETPQCSLWFQDALPDWADVAFEEHTSRTFTRHELPPLEESLESRTSAESKIDLIPSSWKEAQRSRHQRKKTARWIILLLGVWILGMGGILGRNLWIGNQLQNLREKNMSTATQQVAQLEEQLRTLSPFTNRESSALNSLLHIAVALPENGSLVLNQFRYSKGNEFSCGGKIQGSSETFYQFLGNLSGQEKVEVLRYDVKNVSNGITFQVDFQWRNPQQPLEGAL